MEEIFHPSSKFTKSYYSSYKLKLEKPSGELISVVYDSFYQTMTVTGPAGLAVETKDESGVIIGSGIIGSDGTVTYTLNTAGQLDNAPIHTKSALSNTVSHSLVVIPSSEIPSNEMHFTTLAGSADYVGTQGDQILLSDGSIVDITATDETVTFNAPSGKHIVKLVASVGRNNYVSVGGEALVELHNFPALSTVTRFNFATYNNNALPNLTKVPNFLPSNIIDLEGLFFQATSFNQPLNNWNVSNVTNMVGMFANANSFNQPLNNWNVSNVTDMRYMFGSASAFNQPLNNWNVSNVTDMVGMFEEAASFNQPLNNWNVSNVTDMSNMFYGASAFNQPLNNWNVSNVTNIVEMFYGASAFDQPLNNWNVSNVTDMEGMFGGASAFNQDLNNWDVSNVTRMHSMFRDTSAFNQPLNNWDVSNVTVMNQMFRDANAFNQDLSMWCVSNFPTMPSEFDLNATNWTLPKPVWGTCPAP